MTVHPVRRRDFLTLLGGVAAAWPIAARAQQPRAMPVIGFLHMGSPDGYRTSLAAFRQGLNEAGFVEGRNVAIEFRWAEGQYDRLQTLAADLVRQRVAVLFVNGPPGVRAARAATETIPIVFAMGEDPVIEGLVASLNRPGANITGHTSFSNQLAAKRLGLMHESIVKDGAFAFLVNPTNPNVEADTRNTQKAADTLRRQLKVFTARSADDFETAFAAMVEQRVSALIVNVDSFFLAQHRRITALAAQRAIPAMYDRREFPDAGGLMSYGTNFVEYLRQVGIYVGRILNGEKAADLPVQRVTKFEFVLNLKTAKALGLIIPPGVLAIVDEVIE